MLSRWADASLHVSHPVSGTPQCLAPELFCPIHCSLLQTFCLVVQQLTRVCIAPKAPEQPSAAKHQLSLSAPANYDIDSESCFVPSVDSASKHKKWPLVVLNEPLHSTDVDGSSKCSTLHRSNRICLPFFDLSQASGSWARKEETFKLGDM